jgi:signal transduction histidine kinase
MSLSDDHLEIVIADNGRGFDWNAIQRGNGLTNLQVRLQSVGGQCLIEPQPGKGTRIKLIVPLPRKADCHANSMQTHEITQ